MLQLLNIDHIGLRIRDKQRSIDFYQSLGFDMIRDAGFEEGHPVMMKNNHNIVLNLLGPTSEDKDENILMDVEDKRYAGYTHIALRVSSVKDAEERFNELGYAITGRMNFNGFNAVFIRDPDRNVIEFNEFKPNKQQAPQH